MKKNLLLLKCLVAMAWCFILSAVVRADRITATMGPVPCAIIGPNLAFGADHAVRFFTAVEVTKDGQLYVSPGAKTWNLVTNASGAVTEEHAGRFTWRDAVVLNSDRGFYSTIRSFPREAIETITVARSNDVVRVISRLHGGQVFTARVTREDPVNGSIETDYPADFGDSGSRVEDPNGNVVGFIGARIPANTSLPSTGSIVRVPGLDVVLAGTRPATPVVPVVVTPTPAPVPPPPIPVVPTLTQSQLDAAVSAVSARERASFVSSLQALIKQLQP